MSVFFALKMKLHKINPFTDCSFLQVKGTRRAWQPGVQLEMWKFPKNWAPLSSPKGFSVCGLGIPPKRQTLNQQNRPSLWKPRMFHFSKDLARPAEIIDRSTLYAGCFLWGYSALVFRV